MQLLVCVTDDGKGGTTGPTLFLRDRADTALSSHPRSLKWRYFATIDHRDDLLSQTPHIADVIEDKGFFIENRMI